MQKPVTALYILQEMHYNNIMVRQKTSILAMIIFMLIVATGYAQVNQEELQQDLPNVVFINFEGPHTRLDTWEQIRQIGVVLGQEIGTGINNMAAEQRRGHSFVLRTGILNRYFVIHSSGGGEEGKLDADIFGFGVDVAVDHIRNVRLILQGYLQAAYNYSARDAALLAHYITVYNAVFRGNWDYFTSRFQSQVIENLVRERAGISIRYDEWPGRTMMLIPLGRGGGALSAIDTTAITGREVIEELRREDDRGVPLRQQMVDLMEREADQAERLAQAERQEILQEERAIAQERQEIAQERQAVQEAEEAGIITPAEAQQAQQELDRREDAVEERVQAVEQRREEAENLEEFAEQKREEARQERQEIALDQQAIIVQEMTGGVFGITIERDSPTTKGRIIRIDTAGRELRRSPLNTVHVQTLAFVGGRILAVAGEATGRGAVRLVEINQTNLEMARQGEDDIKTGSLLWVNGNDLYAITVDLANNNSYIGRFNTNLVLQARSDVRVHPKASISIQQGRLLTQHPDGSVLMLNPADLTEIR